MLVVILGKIEKAIERILDNSQNIASHRYYLLTPAV